MSKPAKDSAGGAGANVNKTSELQSFLFDQIPLARSLSASVVHCDLDRAELMAPLEPNRNHLGTAFGGSLGAVLILTGYTWLYNAMAARGHKCHVLLKTSNVDYLQPVDTDFSAVARAPEAAEFEKFLKAFERKGSARITIHALIARSNGNACNFEGVFVAKASTDSRLG